MDHGLVQSQGPEEFAKEIAPMVNPTAVRAVELAM